MFVTERYQSLGTDLHRSSLSGVRYQSDRNTCYLLVTEPAMRYAHPGERLPLLPVVSPAFLW